MAFNAEGDIIRQDQKSKMILNVVISDNETAKRNLSSINPSLEDEDFYALAEGYASLQAYPLSYISRDDSATLVEE